MFHPKIIAYFQRYFSYTRPLALMKSDILNKILFTIILITNLNVYSQEKNEPIIFGEFIFGGAGEINGKGGFLLGGELNYQRKTHLFSARYLEHIQLESDAVFLSPFTPIPIIREKINHQEIALLYGKRWIYNGSSLSISGGVSLNTYSNRITDKNNEQIRIKEDYIGIPLEVNFKWFKSRKKRYRIYGIIPVGKPTAFGRNFGFKLIGNISENSFVGLGIVYGFGIHKKY